MNPYDRCEMNRILSRKQCTILWHVDDLKISHDNDKLVTNIIDKIIKQFTKDKPLSITRGLIHKYLGMKINLSNAVKVMFTMYDYVKNMLEELPEEWLSGGSETPDDNQMFSVDPDSDNLSKKDAVFFNHNVAKLLCLLKRARPNIQPTIAFVCKHIHELDLDDAKKLVRIMIYLQKTLYLPLILEADGIINVVKWWIDTSYGVQLDMISYTRATITLEKGSINSFSNAQKINTKSSTESELVVVDDVVSMVL